MEDSPVLVSNVEFDEVKRGYDPEQVDNYLAKVGEAVGQLKGMVRSAVERAESADARVAETLRSKAQAESALVDFESGLARVEAAKVAAEAERDAALVKLASPPEDPESEALKKMLMLAQRTADSAVEEAQASAKNIVADARTKAAEVVADAETRAERLLIEAQKVADELIKEKTGALVLQVRNLERRRDDLFVDVQALVEHLKDHRMRLHDAVIHMGSLIDGPIALRADGLPDLRTLVGESTVADKVAEIESAAAVAEALVSPAPATPVPAPAVSPAPAPSGAIPVEVGAATGDTPAVSGSQGSPPFDLAGGSADADVSGERSDHPLTMPVAPGDADPVAARPDAAKVSALVEEPRAAVTIDPVEVAVESPPALADPAVAPSEPLVIEPVAIEHVVIEPDLAFSEPELAFSAPDLPEPMLYDQADDSELTDLVPPDPDADEAMRKFLEDDFAGGKAGKGIFRRTK